MRRSGRGSAVKARQEVDELSPDKPGESEAVPSSARSRRAAGTGVAGAKRVRSSPADKAKALPKQPGKRGRKKSSAREEKEEIDELSPEKADAAGSGPKDRLRRSRRSVGEPGESAATTSRSRRGRRSSARETELAEEESEEAEEIDEQEAARRLARKRPRRSLRDEASPELDSRVAEDEPTGRKRRKKDVVKSPAAQKQPQPRQRKGTAATHGGNAPAVTTKRRSTKAPTGQTATRGKRKAREADELQDDAGGDDDGGGRDGSVAVTVQRFTKRVLYDTTGAAAAAAADGDDNSGADVLAADIPFAKRGGPNAVDVLAQACEDLLEGFLGNLQERARSARRDAAEAGEAGDAVGKKRREIRVMMRALEEFREELRTRLLEHTIALDTVHALGKRIRATQKEKLSLREDILRIRAEREQVALRMDALRIKHEEDREKALQNNRISSAMHDVDLAVERGVAAPPLPAAEARTAELPNLELLIRSVADQACSRSDGGGLLKQVKDFNAFLERAAAALEGR
ncbi:hypothetical protein VTK73DRAFT_9843 [Phialemonium thermophilum]|uniref:Inner kinetochore subunit AME1 domain-containing protein n=1 Tax=Phialemonium thermophilum TaxID=223376 RepID=A0ABR3W005_9PEZI